MKKYQVRNIRGATMTEYVLLIGLIAAGAVIALTSVGTNISTFFTNLATRVSSSGSAL
jgi:Flp pilus assembly pilin Flp